MNPFDVTPPGRLCFGRGRFADLGTLAAPLGTSALVITGAHGKASGLADRAVATLSKAGLKVVAWSGVVPNPTTDNVEEAARLAREHKVNLVVGIGGGSAMDAAKAVAVAAAHPGPAWDYIIGQKPVTAATLPIIAVPTTAGTGSHVTCFAVITNPATQQKPGMGSPHIVPRLAVLDPELTVNAPRSLTLMTGFDVFSHAVEAYTSQAATPFSDLYARGAIEHLALALPRCLADGKNLDAREGMMIADTCSGIAIARAVVSVGHALAHVIGGRYPEIAHGDALYSIYRPLLAFNAEAMPEKHRWIANCLKPGCTDISVAFESFFGAHSFPNLLRQRKPDAAAINQLVADVWGYLKFAVDLNPRSANQDDLKRILAAAVA